MAPRIFLRWLLINLNYTNSNKNRTLYIDKKEMQIHKDLQFSSTIFFFWKILHDSLIINVISYLSFKFLD